LARGRSKYLHRTGVGTKEAEEERDGRGFPCPVGPEESHRLASGYLEAQVIESDPVPIAAHDLIETQGQLSIDPPAPEGVVTDAQMGC
jgi:hypothetical protein